MMNKRYPLLRSRHSNTCRSNIHATKKGSLPEQTCSTACDPISDRMSRKKSSNDSSSSSSGKKSSKASSSSSAGNWKPQSASLISQTFPRLLIIISCTVVLASIIFEYRVEVWTLFENTIGTETQTVSEPFVSTGGWRLADKETRQHYESDICNIERRLAHELNDSEFEKLYRHKKPVIVYFKNGAKDWTDPTKWTVESLKREYGEWSVLSGNAREIVRRGGSGYVDTSFVEYIDKLMNESDIIGEPYYVFDRDFYNDSSLPSTLRPPSYFQIKDGIDDSIFFLGSSGSGVSFHKHADAWNGVIYGSKRWFLYMVNKTPPGGVYPGYTQREWYDKIYPELLPDDKPLECIQNPGEIIYLPEGLYHGTINLGDTIAIGIQKKEAVTKIEKLFYDERKIVESMRNKKEVEKQKLLKKKQDVIETLLKELPGSSEVHMKAGSMYMEIGDLAAAKLHTQQAIDIDKHFVIAVLNLAGIESKLGDMEEAERLYKHAQNMNPKLWDVYAQYGDFLLGSGRAGDAVHIYRKGTELEPNTLPFWVQLRHAQLLAGDTKGAEKTQEMIDKLTVQH